jgi:hypothetical protein
VTGTIMLIPDYDAADAAPQTEVIACSYRGTMAMVPWTECFEMRLDPGMMNLGTSHKFIRTSGLAANLDIKTYDSANVYLAATDGSAVNWGKLWVESTSNYSNLNFNHKETRFQHRLKMEWEPPCPTSGGVTSSSMDPWLCQTHREPTIQLRSWPLVFTM